MGDCWRKAYHRGAQVCVDWVRKITVKSFFVCFSVTMLSFPINIHAKKTMSDVINEPVNDENEQVNRYKSTRSKRASIDGIELQDYTPVKSTELSPSVMKRKAIDVISHEPDSDDDTDYYDSPAPTRRSLSPLPPPRSPMRSPVKRFHGSTPGGAHFPSPSMRTRSSKVSPALSASASKRHLITSGTTGTQAVLTPAAATSTPLSEGKRRPQAKSSVSEAITLKEQVWNR